VELLCLILTDRLGGKVIDEFSEGKLSISVLLMQKLWKSGETSKNDE
jgi:hypothetical protein